MCVRDTVCASCPCVTGSFQVHLDGDAGPVWVCNQLQVRLWQSTAGWGSCGSRGTHCLGSTVRYNHCLGSTARYHHCFASPFSQKQTPSIPYHLSRYVSGVQLWLHWLTACVSGKFPLSSHCCKHGCEQSQSLRSKMSISVQLFRLY